MQMMTYDEFMKKPDRLRRRLLHKADDVAFKLEICLKATTTLGERVQTSRGNSTEASILAYIDARKELEDLAGEQKKAADAVSDFLYGNLDYDDADLLEWKYVNGKSLSEIADITDTAYQTVKNRISAAEKSAREKFGTNRY